MQHFFENIQGWFDFENVYIDMINLAPNPAHFVEVGSWMGRSSAFMCVEIVKSGKHIQFDCVDMWNGVGHDGYADYDSVKNQTLFVDFMNNMKPAQGLFTPIREMSTTASRLYVDGSLDFVFLDAGHDYDDIKADIAVWLPKVKPNGFIGGHDYANSQDIRQAVHESFPKPYLNTASWLVRI